MKKAVGAALFTSDRKLIFQHRDNLPGISFPDKISLFGGGAEEGENELETLYRELEEETGLGSDALKNPERLLQFFESQASNGMEDFNVIIYLFQDVNPDSIDLREGQGIVVYNPQDDPATYDFTPLALAVIKAVQSRMSQAA